jgi:ferredoxin-NADP reductase
MATVVDRRLENPNVLTITFDAPAWQGHLAGQHVDIRLTADDGYVAQRSYSLASAADQAGQLQLTVERVQEGEVSSFLIDELRVGDAIEMRGPIGGYFTWSPTNGDPLMLVAGGSGVVPLMSMLRTRGAASIDKPTRLLYSSRTEQHIIYREELVRLQCEQDNLTVVHTLTRDIKGPWTGKRGRIGREFLAAHGFKPFCRPLVFVCGPTPFVEAITTELVSMGHSEAFVRTERFGPTGALR